MRVEVMATSFLNEDIFDNLDHNPGDDYPTDCDHLAEFAGRACYQSFDRPNEKTASNPDYLANIIKQQHESVLAHASVTFYITGVSRNLTLELIRSRFLAYSQESQRYVPMGKSYTVVPPAFRGLWAAEQLIEAHHERSVALYEDLVRLAEAEGLTGKAARQAARAVLPGGTDTKIVVSGNIRAWRDFIRQRNTLAADPEIRELAQEILKHLQRLAPNSVSDLGE